MSRIRSVHPGLFTDDKFVSVSDAAQIFYIGLLTEADDNGVFEWNPIKLKMRLRPAALEPIDGLLSELVQAEKIAPYEIEGRKLGAIRNFRRFQRPKSPKAVHSLPPRWRSYVGLTDAIPEMPPDDDVPIPPNGENPPQMEEGGWKRKGNEEGRKDEDAAGAASKSYFFENGTIRLTEGDFEKWKTAFSYLDLRAELIGLTEWAGQQGDRWFYAVSAALAKRNRAAKVATEKPDGKPSADAAFWGDGTPGIQ